MFRSEERFGLAMMKGRVFNNGGWICKFDPKVLLGGKIYSPFVCTNEDAIDWEPMNATWRHRKGMFEVFGEVDGMKTERLPELEVDTKVFVKEIKSNNWVPRHFMEWGYRGRVLCYANGDTSFSETDKDGTDWKFWKIAEGVHKGKTNIGIKSYKQENNNE